MPQERSRQNCFVRLSAASRLTSALGQTMIGMSPDTPYCHNFCLEIKDFSALVNHSDFIIHIAESTSRAPIPVIDAQAETIAPNSAGPIASIRCAPAYASSEVMPTHMAKRTSMRSPAFSETSVVAQTNGADKCPVPPFLSALKLIFRSDAMHIHTSGCRPLGMRCSIKQLPSV